MEAKDTVMTNLAQAVIKHPDLPMGQAIAIEQAETTWKARDPEVASLVGQIADLKALKAQAEITAKQAAVKEVVGFADEQCNDHSHYLGYVERKDCVFCWQAQKKKWGVE